ncbi:hypothetical protein GUITHDRAFT_141111 [Guillardia theta CCMP2712]|uniref:Uncharacterized protein n=1 Tax=Guillardia theta (strain CCMP2712) TaxID=905079 RepID=L1J3K6_GUITC|nr:hypothetical protein GUITHDRAFT_141111 [Guillardia theta CCMP2712]EKX42714.1 hypothetical protein GUITHDRAFT_141111 [Guillardia theta CCMP2712]|eukprot:XP_005829694.1 hypothetical protein GUITHDRAFT_141111 [Guillardia theta CCMP2712]
MPMNPMNSSYARLAEHVWSKASSHVSLHAGDYLLDKERLKRVDSSPLARSRIRRSDVFSSSSSLTCFRRGFSSCSALVTVWSRTTAKVRDNVKPAAAKESTSQLLEVLGSFTRENLQEWMREELKAILLEHPRGGGAWRMRVEERATPQGSADRRKK